MGFMGIDAWLETFSNKLQESNFNEKYQSQVQRDERFNGPDFNGIDVTDKKHNSFSEIISNFDLSCCQIGVLYENGICTTLMSRLFLYTFYTKKIIMMPQNFIEYHVGGHPIHPFRFTYKIYMRNYINFKQGNYNKEEFSKYFSSGEGYKNCEILYKRNLKRVEKYIKRGVGKIYQIIYHQNSYPKIKNKN